MRKLIFQIALAILVLFLGYKCYESIMVPQRFQVIKKQRYDRIIERLKDIRSAQEAYKGVNKIYAAEFDELIRFIKYDSIPIIRSIGMLTDEQVEQGMTEAEAVKKGFIIREVVKVPALTEVFTADYPIDDIRYVPFTNRQHQFKMDATSFITDSNMEVPVFEAWVSNTIIFENIQDDYEEQIKEENGERLRLKKFPGLKVGDLLEANNNVGNWE